MTRLTSLIIGGLFIFLAVVDHPLLGGGLGFGWTQGILLVIGLGLIAACLLKVERHARILAVVLSTCFALILCEVTLRFLFGPKFYPPFQADEKYLYTLIPGATREFDNLPVNGGESVLYRVNAKGFRGPELNRPAKGKRIVVYGDSFIQAEFSALKDTFPAQLAGRLTADLKEGVEVINAGVAGYGPDQQYLRMRDELGWLKPNLVVFSIYAGNDYGDLVRNKLFRVTPNGIEENHPKLDPRLARNFELSKSESIIKKILRHSLNSKTEGSRTVHRDVESQLASLGQEYREFVVAGDNTVRSLLNDPYNADVALYPDSPSAKYKIRLMTEVLKKASETARELSIPMVVLIIPHPMDVDGGSHESESIDRDKYPSYDPRRLTDELQAMCSELGLPYVNLYEPFHKVGAKKLYLKGGDDHWNDAGQAFAAQIMATFLMHGSYLRGADRAPSE